jgi:uncharacterized membrane protein
MLWIMLALSLLLCALGVATYEIAPRVGPNPLFGVRIGYAYASREVWDRTNRFGGMLLALTGVALALLSLLFQWLNFPAGDSFRLLTSIMLVALVAEAGWMFLYARRLAQSAPLPATMRVTFRWRYLAPSLVTFALLVALAALVYPSLPAERMATHFNFADQPDGWMTRDAFYLTYLGLAALFVALNALLVVAAVREPLIAFWRWGERWWLEPARGLIYAGSLFGLVNVMLAVVLWDVAAFNTSGAHAFPLSLLFWLFVPIVVGMVGLFLALARRGPVRN